MPVPVYTLLVCISIRVGMRGESKLLQTNVEWAICMLDKLAMNKPFGKLSKLNKLENEWSKWNKDFRIIILTFVAK